MMSYKDREHQAAQYIIEDLAARAEREKEAQKTVIVKNLAELLLIDRLLDGWKDNAKRSDSDFYDGYALHERVRAALKEQLKD